MADVRSPNMDEKSANYGDRLKHALLLEVLRGTRAWPGLAYAETHAGAGIYRAEGQAARKPEEQYIRLLREETQRTQLAGGDIGPGAAYLGWLKEWWGSPSNDGAYPGSALTALRWLGKHRQPGRFEIRLMESDKEACDRLRGALSIPEDRIRQGSFNDHLDWLTAPEDLVLLIDPFGIVKEFEQGEEDRGLSRGWIDHDIVGKILNRCLSKERAIALFWWSSGQKLAAHHEATSQLFQHWRSKHTGISYRQFHDGRYNHKIGLVGIGRGSGIVSGVAGREGWARTWLKDVIYEKDRKRPG